MPALNEKRKISITKKIPAPLPYVFDWLTDFRVDDNLITGSKFPKKNLEKNDNTVTYIAEQMKNDHIIQRNYVVTMIPPDKWHVEARGEETDTTGDYILSTESDGAILEMNWETTHKVNPIPTKEESERDSHEFWDTVILALLKDYQNGKPAK